MPDTTPHGTLIIWNFDCLDFDYPDIDYPDIDYPDIIVQTSII